ncbi:hypothetical protein ABE545_04260 [Sphingobacterium faecium]|jgi:hypothetical protein
MARQAKIYYQDQLEGYLVEGSMLEIGVKSNIAHKKSDSFEVAFL